MVASGNLGGETQRGGCVVVTVIRKTIFVLCKFMIEGLDNFTATQGFEPLDVSP